MARATTQMMDQAAAALHQVGVTLPEDFDIDDLYRLSYDMTFWSQGW